MSNVVNLNKFRKAKAKAEREKGAGVNRRLHGRTQAERDREALQKRQLTRAVDHAKLEPYSGQANDGGTKDEWEAGD